MWRGGGGVGGCERTLGKLPTVAKPRRLTAGPRSVTKRRDAMVAVHGTSAPSLTPCHGYRRPRVSRRPRASASSRDLNFVIPGETLTKRTGQPSEPTSAPHKATMHIYVFIISSFSPWVTSGAAPRTLWRARRLVRRRRRGQRGQRAPRVPRGRGTGKVTCEKCHVVILRGSWRQIPKY